MTAPALAVLAGVTDLILSLSGWGALAVVFAVPALEASAFVGFVFPGEIAVLLGGVLAYQHRISLAGAIAAAVGGAVVGDAAGYLIGRRWGRSMLQGTLGRLPLVRRHLDRSLDRAQEYVRRRRGRAVFFGRFTTALRVLVPGLAGMSEIHFPTFLAYNVAGGLLWGTGFVLLGYAAGAGYHRVARVAGWLGLALLALVVLGLLVARLAKDSSRLRAIGDPLAATPPLAWIRRRFPRQVAWGRRRLDPAAPTGFALTITVAVGALAAWTFGGLTQDVVAHDESALRDPAVQSFVLAHRVGWLTAFMRAATWLGSTVVIVPLAAAAAIWVSRRYGRRPAWLLAATFVGAVVLYDVAKLAVGRARPPSLEGIGTFTGLAFPSGHATQSLAVYGMLALLLSAGRSTRARTLWWSGAALVALVVGASRVYLGAHWMTDVLAGWALGAAWLCVVVAADLLTRERARSGTRRRQEPDQTTP